jgi:hypothetical protein
MTKPVTGFKIPAVKRAIRIAHAQGLAVDSYDLLPDGTVHIQLRDYELTPTGTVRVSDNEEAAA